MYPKATIILVLGLALTCLVTAQQDYNTDQAQGPTISIVTGPVIGKVTTTTARVLFEFNTEASVTVILTDPAGTQFRTEKTVKASIPVPFAFDGLEPNTKYTVTLDNPSIEMTQSYFTTLSGESGKLNFAVTSCMDQNVQRTKTPEADLWADILRRIENNEIQYLLQTGDQVYMDDPSGGEDPQKPYFACMAILNTTDPSEWESKKGDLMEILRDEYRQTWNIPTVREVLAKIPSLTILDDHQIRDDWGYLPQDSDPNSADYFYGTLARQAYYEYERQLREDIDFNDLSNITQEYYYEILNDIGFIFIEYRGIRSWNRNFSQMGNTQLGLNQTQLIEQLLNPQTGEFANLNNFFLVSPLTMVFLVEALVQVGYFSNNDAQESWSYAYKDEQAQLLDILRNWKLAKEGRQVTILDGDVHMAGYTDITYGDEFAFLQCTSSSIASSAPDDATFLAFDIIKEIQSLVDPWNYEHRDWTNDFNYAIVVAKEEENVASAGCYLIKAPADEAPEMINPEGDTVDGDEWQEILGTN